MVKHGSDHGRASKYPQVDCVRDNVREGQGSIGTVVVLVTRDTFAAVCWGITSRIELTQCDTEVVNKYDFTYDCERQDEAMQELMANTVEYQIHMCQYSLLLGEIIPHRVILSRTSPDAFLERVRLERKLEHLRSWLNLLSSDKDISPCFTICRLESALSLFHEYLRILLYLRKSTIRNTSNHTTEPQMLSVDDSLRDRGSYSHSVLVSASHSTTTMATSLTTQELIFNLPHEYLVGIFSAEVALIGQLIPSDHAASSIAARDQIWVSEMVMHTVKIFLGIVRLGFKDVQRDLINRCNQSEINWVLVEKQLRSWDQLFQRGTAPSRRKTKIWELPGWLLFEGFVTSKNVLMALLAQMPTGQLSGITYPPADNE
ncbi:LOW QUALITY PROTEIN: uncharacterized protein Z520_10052 [Fonsecaea multimorphosa CBS 102226]|uniref:Transcription factor domain-containing protein n=1 Tax=Fonsecaea multimorphosa CBS 102226 TaxID=1442371 RepID=A0A0D2JLZ7_9EURO|nr:LOW QUALITY PROTEIN: uncharacterized protein Z520_10052 [Fonsecaea multimorphosa CBS 102226]KIX94342.1 LOW QUALITY PROTEIN: hypothetical protein Z520_10052 [Fonsecaea multimorphosa CBS 102226]